MMAQLLLTSIQFNTRSWRNWQTRYFEGVVFTRRVGSSPTDRTILFLYNLIVTRSWRNGRRASFRR